MGLFRYASGKGVRCDDPDPQAEPPSERLIFGPINVKKLAFVPIKHF
jgi:hypothetical protein